MLVVTQDSMLVVTQDSMLVVTQDSMLVVTQDSMLVVTLLEEGTAALYLPIGPLKSRSVLESLPRCEPSTY